MSKRRLPGEIVRRKPGSGFDAEPSLVRLPEMVEFERDSEMCNLCDDSHCRKFGSVYVTNGRYRGQQLHHISECQMDDVVPVEAS
jgi:hypothetical protein